MTTKRSMNMTNNTTTKEPNQYSHHLSLPWMLIHYTGYKLQGEIIPPRASVRVGRRLTLRLVQSGMSEHTKMARQLFVACLSTEKNMNLHLT